MGVTRRAVLARAGLSAGALALGGGVARAAAAPGRVAYHDRYQAGVTTPQQARLLFQTFDATARSRHELRALLRAWTEAARVMCDEAERILRRGYNYAGGLLPSGALDAGLFFAAFQRDPRRQFVPIQHRLASHDRLNEYVEHTGSAIFAVPPGVRRGGYVGETLLASRAD